MSTNVDPKVSMTPVTPTESNPITASNAVTEPKIQLKNINDLCWNDINYLKSDPKACPEHVMTRKEREQR